jgi:hypothetical protein
MRQLAMPVRSLSSSVLTWPNAKAVELAVRRWAKKVIKEHSGVVRVGYFGSYARGNWGVGSDLDLIIIMEHTKEPFLRRAAGWDVTKLPVPADLLVYSKEEWRSLNRNTRFYRTLVEETVWVYVREGKN